MISVIRDPEMVYPRITRVKVIPRLSPGYQILKVMDNACSAYVLQCTVYSRATEPRMKHCCQQRFDARACERLQPCSALSCSYSSCVSR